ncbi:MAG: RNA ligase family protein [Nitrosarchaeum sp.]|nr:RNA ligase family protein [Nitrosarchaeum sp.]
MTAQPFRIAGDPETLFGPNFSPVVRIEVKEVLTNFPKIECPFIRRYYKADKEQLRHFLSTHKMRLNYDGLLYLITPEINPGYEWVFEDRDTFATEKLDGTNIKIMVKDKRIAIVQNRSNPPIDLFRIDIDNSRYIEGLSFAISRKYIKDDGEYAGELLGPKVQNNPYKLTTHEWYPFDVAISSLRFTAFDKHTLYDRSFSSLSVWFKDYLRSLYYVKRHKEVKMVDSIFAEGVVFYNLKRKAANLWPWMAKMRRDMFRWYYDGVTIASEPEIK